jgi:hypothetical protein
MGQNPMWNPWGTPWFRPMRSPSMFIPTVYRIIRTIHMGLSANRIALNPVVSHQCG